jgi:hypothetical protein
MFLYLKSLICDLASMASGLKCFPKPVLGALGLKLTVRGGDKFSADLLGFRSSEQPLRGHLFGLSSCTFLLDKVNLQRHRLAPKTLGTDI